MITINKRVIVILILVLAILALVAASGFCAEDSTTDYMKEEMGKFISGFFNSYYQPGEFENVLEDGFISYMIQLSKIYAGVIAAIAFFSETYNLVFNGRGDIWGIVVRVIIVVLLLSSFNYLYFHTITVVDSTIKVISEQSITGNAAKLTEQELNDQQQEEEGAVFDKMYSVLVKLRNLPINILLVRLSMFISQVAIFIILGVRNVSFTILAAFGPPALITYLHPKTEQYAVGWLKSYINVLSWPFIIVVILNIQKSVSGLMLWTEGIPERLYYIQLFGYNIILSFMLFKTMTFMPNLLKGKAGAFSATQTMLSTAMTAFYAVKTAGSGGVGGVGLASKLGLGLGGKGGIGPGLGSGMAGSSQQGSGRVPSDDGSSMNSSSSSEDSGFEGALDEESEENNSDQSDKASSK